MDFQPVTLTSQQKTYPFLIDYLPEEHRKKAEKELRETKSNSLRLMYELKFILNNEKSTQGIYFNEDFLRQFLRQNKYDIPRTLKRIYSFVAFRRSYQKYFQIVDPVRLSEIPDYRFCTVLPWRCKDGCVIIIYELEKWNPKNISVDDILRLAVIMYHQSLRNPLTQINGFKLICDWKGSNLRQLKCMTPQTLYASYQSIFECTPARTKKVHMINESFPMKAMWTVFRHFLSEKLRKRFIFHSSHEGLLNYFPKHTLPVQYGGDLDNYYMSDWMQEANRQQRYATIHGQDNYF